jgi:hypothetical protein
MNAAAEGHQHNASRPTRLADLETETVEGERVRDDWSGAPSTDKQPYSF